MAAIPSRRVAFEENRPGRCAHSGPHLIYDDPHIFRVRGQHSVPHPFSCDACWKAAKQQQHPNANIQHPKRCSRLPPTPADLERLSRPRTAPPQRTANNCNWDNFMKKKSKYGKPKKLFIILLISFSKIVSAITTPHGLCDLASDQQNLENRPAFVNYGGRFTDKQFGQKRTFNSLAIHVSLVKYI